MSQTYCLLVGINEYSNVKHNLKGCINDLNNFRKYLELSYDKEVLNIRTLENGQATKNNIIQSFKFLQQAQNGDTCIFYFSGHGSTWDAPEYLTHLIPDKLLKSLVCHDSRESGKIDLMNIELAYLIWEANYQKEIQFIVITDCCHSGDVTRDESDINLTGLSSRELKKGSGAIPTESFYPTKGLSKKELLNSKLQIKRGRHIHLAACRGDQKAVEGEVQKVRQGIFTYHLLNTLKKHAGKITYKELIDKVRIKVQNKIPNQSPQLFAVEDADNRNNFLSSTMDTGNIQCQVYYKRNHGWVVNCGSLNSPLGGNPETGSYIKLLNGQKNLKISQVGATFSNLSNTNVSDLDTKQIYNAHLILENKTKLYIGFQDIPKNLSKELIEECRPYSHSSSFNFTNIFDNAKFLLRYQKDTGYYLTDKTSDQSLFRKNITFSEENLPALFMALEKVSRWNHLLNLKDLDGSNLIDHISLNFFRVTDSGNQRDNALKEPVQNSDVIRLEHEYSEGKYHDPGFQLNITNISDRPLWISLLYLSDDYSITNRLISKQFLLPNTTVWALQKNNIGNVFKTINVKLSDQLHEAGKTFTLEYLKVLISTEEFDTNYFNQASVSSNKDFKELKDMEDGIKLAEWGTQTICLEIHRPL